MGAVCSSKENHPKKNMDEGSSKKKVVGKEVMSATTRPKSSPISRRKHEHNREHNSEDNESKKKKEMKGKVDEKGRFPELPLPRIVSDQPYMDQESMPLFEKEAMEMSGKRHKIVINRASDNGKYDKFSQTDSQDSIDRINTFEQNKLLDKELGSSFDPARQDTGRIFGNHSEKSVLSNSASVTGHSNSNLNNNSNSNSNNNSSDRLHRISGQTKIDFELLRQKGNINSSNESNTPNIDVRTQRNLSFTSDVHSLNDIDSTNMTPITSHYRYDKHDKYHSQGRPSQGSLLSVETSHVGSHGRPSGPSYMYQNDRTGYAGNASVVSIKSNDSVLFDWQSNNDSHLQAIMQARNEYDNSIIKSPSASK